MSQCKLQKLSYINSICLWFCGLEGVSWTWLGDYASRNGSGWVFCEVRAPMTSSCVLSYLEKFSWRCQNCRGHSTVTYTGLLPHNIPLAQQVTWLNPKSRCGESIFHPLPEGDFKVTWDRIEIQGWLKNWGHLHKLLQVMWPYSLI